MISHYGIYLNFIFALLLTGCATTSHQREEVQSLSQTKSHYQRLAQYQWQPITSNRPLTVGKTYTQIPHIRQRLSLLGDLKGRQQANIQFFDPALQYAVRQFQKRHGLKADGVIGKGTLHALNVSPKQRLFQIQQSIQEWQKLPLKQDYIQVNLPSYQLKVMEEKGSSFQMKVVVGSPDWPTPMIQSELKTIVVNPRWSIPRNITEKEIIQKIVEDPTYLEQENIKIFAGWQRGAKEIMPEEVDWQSYLGDRDLPYRLIQTSGLHNALGKVKFTFPNTEHIYLHDTPNKQAFELSNRNLSHGCIRLQKPIELVHYLIDHNRMRSPKRVLKALESPQGTKHFPLKTPLPIYITNISSWVDQSGAVQFRRPYKANVKGKKPL